MKPYLCIEDGTSLVKVQGISTSKRDWLYFVLTSKSRKEAEKKAKKLRAKVVRVLTEEEAATEAEDGSYDINLWTQRAGEGNLQRKNNPQI